MKRVYLLLLGFTLAFALTACESGEKTPGETEEETGFVVENIGQGLRLTPTEVEEKYLEKEQLILEEIPHFGIGLSYVNQKGIDLFKELEGKTSEEVDPSVADEFIKNMDNYAVIIRMPDNEVLAGQVVGLNQVFPNQEILEEDEENGNVLIFWKDTDEDLPSFTDKDQEELNELIENLPKLRENLEISEPATSMGELPEFEAKTFSGNSFTKEDFAKHDLTMVNIWASWCGPCIAEMPDLQEVKENLPENMNIITINADADENEDISREILKENRATFETLIPEEVLKREILSTVQVFPTTIFVDKEGKIVGEKLMGAPNGNISEEYIKAMEETWETIK